MMKFSDLSEDLVGEILSRVPFTSLVPVRLTCNPWNAWSKQQILGTRAEATKMQQFMVLNSRVCSLRFHLQGIRNEEDEFIDPSIKQVSMFDEIDVSQVFHCDGSLLCVTNEVKNARVMVWNSYLGQTRWIRPRIKFHRLDGFALGLDNKSNLKILRFEYKRDRCIEVYDFSSDSWKFLDTRPDSVYLCFRDGVSLKGNAYFFDKEITVETEVAYEMDVIDFVDYLICFCFTTERFGPRLPLPFDPPPTPYFFKTVTLSSVRDDKLSVLYRHNDTYEMMEIWITTMIEPNAVSWSKFLRVDISLISGLPPNDFQARSFFIDEEKKVAVVFNYRSRKTTASIIGEDGYFKSVDIGAANPSDYGNLVCSYVPNLVQL